MIRPCFRKPNGRKATIASNVLFSIPAHILFSIVNRVGRLRFEELGPLLRTGILGRDLVYTEDVLKEACLQTLLDEPGLVNTRSVYHPFFKRCVKAGNVVACYLESLRLAVTEGKIEEAIDLLLKTSPLSEEMEFALGIFLLSRGQYYMGIERLDSFTKRVGSHARAEYVSSRVFAQMLEIMPLGIKRPPYTSTWRFEDLPKCVGGDCTMYNRCEYCFNWWRYAQFISLF